MEQKDKNIWVDEVMDSLAGMRQVAAPAGMYADVMARINKDKRSQIKVLLPRVAAAAVLLLAINIASVYHVANKGKASQQQGVYQTIDEQFSSLSDGY